MRVTRRMIAGTAVTVVVVASAWVAVANEANQSSETTPNTGSRSRVASSSSTSASTSTTAARSVTTSATVTSTTTSTAGNVTTAKATVRQLSPAWVEAQPFMDLEATPGDLDLRLWADRYLSNPNQWSTPMGALCWGYFELGRLTALASSRIFLDTLVIPRLVEELGLSEDLLASGLGPAASKRVIDTIAALVSSPPTSTTDGSTSTSGTGSNTTSTAVRASRAIDSEFVDLLRLLDYSGGTGTEWMNGLDKLASDEWSATVRAGDGLSEPVLGLADWLAARAREQIGKDTPDFVLLFDQWEEIPRDGEEAFNEMAKYDQNCLRADIGEPSPGEPLAIPDPPRPGATTTTVRSGSVRVSGNGLNGVLRLGLSGVGVGYSRPGGAGSLTDTTFRHGGVGYEVERLLWWPNGTVRLDVYPDGLHTAVGDDAYLVITPGEDDNPIEYVWDTADARYLGGGADFVWDATWEPEFGTVYRVEFRIGVPGVPENVRLSGTSVVWDAGDGPAAAKYHVRIRPAVPGPGTDSFFNTPTFGTEAGWDMRGMAWYVGDSLLFQVRAYNSAGYSPWTEPLTFTTPGSYHHHIDNPGYYVHDILGY